jgi:hypothetical protein
MTSGKREGRAGKKSERRDYGKIEETGVFSSINL